MENNTNEDTVPIYVEVEIQDEWLSSKIEKDKFIIGESLEIDKLGTTYKLDSNSKYEAGATFRVNGEIGESKSNPSI